MNHSYFWLTDYKQPFLWAHSYGSQISRQHFTCAYWFIIEAINELPGEEIHRARSGMIIVYRSFYPCGVRVCGTASSPSSAVESFHYPLSSSPSVLWGSSRAENPPLLITYLVFPVTNLILRLCRVPTLSHLISINSGVIKGILYQKDPENRKALLSIRKFPGMC